MTSSPPNPDFSDHAPLVAAWRMGIVALVLFTAYLSIVLGEALPPRLLDPAWQIKVIGALVNASAFPLVGLTLLHLASDLEPEDLHLRRRRRLASRLAIAASLGFLLLIPLQAVAIQRQQQLQATNQSGRVRQAEEKLTALSKAIEDASSTTELQQRLQALESPGIGPAQLAQPLPQVKAQLQARLRNAQTMISRQREALQPSDPTRVVVAAFRNGVACLALAIGFAALANRPGVGLPMLMEWQMIGQRRRQLGGQRPGQPVSDISAFFKQIKGSDGPPGPPIP